MDSDIYDSWNLGDEEIQAEMFIRALRRVRNNDPRVTDLHCDGDYDIVRDITAEEWEDIGRDISNNTHLLELEIAEALDDEKISCLFRGLSRSSSVIKLGLSLNEFSAAGLMSLESFLKKSTNLRDLDVISTNIQTDGFNFLMRTLLDTSVESLNCSNCGITSIEIKTFPNNLLTLDLDGNDIKSEGFNHLLRSLRDSSIEYLRCSNCHIESIDNDTYSFPRSLKTLALSSNRIVSNVCYEIAKLLQEGGRLEKLFLGNNLIGDEGVEILVDALKTNTSLEFLDLLGNDAISRSGQLHILQMLNDISSIKSTLQSNHTLQIIILEPTHGVHRYINNALSCNMRYSVRAGREKVIETQLHSRRRAELLQIQEIQRQSVYGEIDPLHLPEVLSLVGRRHGQEELYLALKASIAEVITDHC